MLRLQAGSNGLSLLQNVQTHNPSHSLRTLGLFPSRKRRRREDDNLLTPRAEVKNERIYTSTPPPLLHDVDRYNFFRLTANINLLDT